MRYCSCGGGSGRPVSPPSSSSSSTFAMRDTKGRECRAALRRRTDSAARPRPSLPVPQIPPLLRGESHLHRAIYGCVFSILLPLPSAPSRPTDRVSMPRRILLLENSTFLLGPDRRVLLARLSTFDGRCAKWTLVKCRGEILINAYPE